MAELDVQEVELVKDLNNEFFSVTPETIFHDPESNLNSEFFSVKLEVEVKEADRSRNSELPFVRLETMFQVIVNEVEQERGLELQISFPESTLAPRLLTVSVIVFVNALKSEFLSANVWVRPRVVPLRLRV